MAYPWHGGGYCFIWKADVQATKGCFNKNAMRNKKNTGKITNLTIELKAAYKG